MLRICSRIRAKCSVTDGRIYRQITQIWRNSVSTWRKKWVGRERRCSSSRLKYKLLFKICRPSSAAASCQSPWNRRKLAVESSLYSYSPWEVVVQSSLLRGHPEKSTWPRLSRTTSHRQNQPCSRYCWARFDSSIDLSIPRQHYPRMVLSLWDLQHYFWRRLISSVNGERGQRTGRGITRGRPRGEPCQNHKAVAIAWKIFHYSFGYILESFRKKL